METVVNRVFHFAGYTLDLSRGSLRAGDRDIELRPKSFEVLRYLVENSGRLVTKDEILTSVWPNVFVTEDSLVRCVHEIRQALGDRDQLIIRTLPRRGYLFDAEVSCAAGEAAKSLGPSSVSEPGRWDGGPVARSSGAPRKSWQWPVRLLAAALAVTGFVLAGLFLWPPDAPDPTVRASIAVLPFANASGDPRYARLGDAISEDLVTNLSKFAGITVAAHSSATAYRRKTVSAGQVGRALSVRYLLEGSVRADGERLRITAQLVDTATGEQLWAERYDRQLLDAVTAQDEVSREIAATLASTIRKADLTRAARTPEDALSAYELVLRATELSANNPNKRSSLEARALFQRALDLDPSFVPAYELLGRDYYRSFVLQWEGPEALEKALQLAQRAISLDNTSPSAYDLLGRVYLRRGQHETSIATLEKAIALNPNLSEGYASLADTLTFAGRPEEAVDLAKKAARLDPFHPPYVDMYLGRALYFAGQYGQALMALDTCVARAPAFRPCYMYLAPVYAEMGRMDDARRTVSTLLAVSPDFSIDRSVRRHLPYVAESMQYYIAGLRKAGVPE